MTYFRIVKHSNCKTWLQFGQTEGSITKQNIDYTLMGTYEHLWGICDLRDYNFDSQNTKYSFRPTRVVRIGYRPKRDLHSVIFPFDCSNGRFHNRPKHSLHFNGQVRALMGYL